MEQLNFASEELSLSLETDFHALCEKICELFHREGLSTRPFARSKGFFFRSLDFSHQERVLNRLRNDLEIYSSTIEGGYSLRDSNQLFWRALKKFNFTPLGELFSEIESDHIIEIYDGNGLQIFRNLNFFDVCSYSLEDVVCREWWHLYQRDVKITEMIFERTTACFKQETPHTYDPQIPFHFLNEIDSCDKNSMIYEINRVSPLMQNGNTVAIVALEKCKLI